MNATTVTLSETVPIKKLLVSWSFFGLLGAIGASLLGGAELFETYVDLFIPATVVFSFLLLAWEYEVEN